MNKELLEQIESKTWHTCLVSNFDNCINIFKGRGLDAKRDDIDSEDLNDDLLYIELDEFELKELGESNKYDIRLMGY